MKIGVLGAGTWGIALSKMLASSGHEVTVWSALKEEIDQLQSTHIHPKFPQVVLPDSLSYTTDTDEACGGKEVIIYFGDEVEEALRVYEEERRHIIPAEGHEDAFFLSLQRKRMSARSVENLVKKYARTVTTLKNITPHKLRSTYGTNLYRETGDIYLVADVLGHSDVNTTRKHYAALEDERRRSARNKVQLRERNDT